MFLKEFLLVYFIYLFFLLLLSFTNVVTLSGLNLAHHPATNTQRVVLSRKLDSNDRP